jgi:uncharacterized RDD family membrane protein YckC
MVGAEGLGAIRKREWTERGTMNKKRPRLLSMLAVVGLISVSACAWTTQVGELPAFHIVGIVLILRSPERARFGDRVAGTRVVRSR